MSELVKVDMAQYGLDEIKAKEIRKDFDAVLKIAEELETEYNELIVKPIDESTVKEAKALRLKYVKVRTGISAVHKDRKAFYLSGGRAIDGLKNAYTHAVEGNEAKLEQIETHFERIEAERIAEVQAIRSESLSKFNPDYIPSDLGSMKDDVWNNYIAGVELAFNAKKEAEAKAEADRIAKEKAEAEERERIRIENEKLKAEAVERDRLAKIEADKRAKEDADRKAKEEAERQERLKEQARIETERVRKQAEHEAELKKEREAREKIEREQKAKEEAEKKAKAEADALASDKAHRASIHNQTLECFKALDVGLNEDQCKSIVKAIVSGKIANVSIKY